jgi:hypothetical protein
MKTIILDAGPIITLALNNLLWLFEKVKIKHKINFYMTEAVKKEVIDNPLSTKKFKFEALQVMNLVDRGIISVFKHKDIGDKTKDMLELANSSLFTRAKNLKLVHYPEMSAIAASLLCKADAVMIDERTTRYLIEQPKRLVKLLERKLHTNLKINKKSVLKLGERSKSVKFIRSAEFVTVAFEKGLLDDYLPKTADSKRTLLEALLWGLKLNGCAIATKDLEILLGAELKYIKARN